MINIRIIQHPVAAFFILPLFNLLPILYKIILLGLYNYTEWSSPGENESSIVGGGQKKRKYVRKINKDNNKENNNENNKENFSDQKCCFKCNLAHKEERESNKNFWRNCEFNLICPNWFCPACLPPQTSTCSEFFCSNCQPLN